MADRKKVITALQLEVEYQNTWDCKDKCPYYGKTDCDCYTQVAKDALELLKEQEAIKPKLVGVNTWTCGECGTLLGWEDLSQSGLELISYKYCPGCGKKVKWDD